MSIDITVRHTAEAAHRIPILDGAGAKCRNVHGHSWQIEWTFATAGKDLKDLEFGKIKKILRGWVDDKFDHAYLSGEKDELGRQFAACGLKVLFLPHWPTTEALVEFLADKTGHLLPRLELSELVLREGFSNAATWRKPPAPAPTPVFTVASGGAGGAGGGVSYQTTSTDNRSLSAADMVTLTKRALELRLSGRSIVGTAQILGISPDTVTRLLDRAVELVGKATS